MIEAGLNVVPCSDDPGMFPNSLTNEYRILAGDLAVPRERLIAMSLAGADACWLPDTAKAELRTRLQQEIAVL